MKAARETDTGDTAGTAARMVRHPFEAVGALWRLPGVTVARLTLDSYVRRGWILLDLLAVMVMLLALFYPFAATTAAFYGSAGLALLGLAVLGSVIVMRFAMSARTYLILARLPSRASYGRGMMIAACTLRVFDCLLATVLAVATGRIIHPMPGPLAMGLIGVMADCVVVAALTVTLCAPIGSRAALILFLVWFIAAFLPVRDAAHLPAVLPALVGLARLPLAPFSTLFGAGATGADVPSILLALAVEAVYIGALAWIAGVLLERRELLLH